MKADYYKNKEELLAAAFLDLMQSLTGAVHRAQQRCDDDNFRETTENVLGDNANFWLRIAGIRAGADDEAGALEAMVDEVIAGNNAQVEQYLAADADKLALPIGVPWQ